MEEILTMQTSSIGEQQFVTLGIGTETFGIEVTAVREILEVRPITRLPQCPPYLLGMIDVRGSTVPVIDLRSKLGLPPTDASEHTRILVLDIPGDAGSRVLGLLTDRVFEVTSLDEQVMQPPPDIGVRWRSDYIKGLGRRGEAFVVVFNLQRLFSTDETALIDSVSLGAP
jgi:purine-binding chemotaxis protein CheW